MNFIDQAAVLVQAGNGGDGKTSFRREKFISKGGPDGGDGGNGGNVIFQASNNQSSLAVFRYTKQLSAEAGVSGGPGRRHGKNGKDLIVLVPVGTEAKDSSGKIVADLVNADQTVMIAQGGKGGFGNAHFVSSRRQAPDFSEKGEPGEKISLNLELKMLADVGLVGLPNAGKSTLLRAISHARPKVANYPFTTLDPSVGVVDVDANSSLLFADIPGLIEGAALGKGLGHDFLRHIERTSVIVHVIDAYEPNLTNAYLTIRKELKAYKPQLLKRPEIIALNKTEGLDSEIIDDLINSLRSELKPKSKPIIPISAKSTQGLKALVYAAKAAKDKLELKTKTVPKQELFTYQLPSNLAAWSVSKTAKGVYKLSGQQIERFAVRTDFTNDSAKARLLDILRKKGVIHELNRQGIKPGDRIVIGDKGELEF